MPGAGRPSPCQQDPGSDSRGAAPRVALESDEPGFEKSIKRKAKASTPPLKFLVFSETCVCICVFVCVYPSHCTSKTRHCYICCFYILLNVLATWKNPLVLSNGCLVFCDAVADQPPVGGLEVIATLGYFDTAAAIASIYL